MLRDLKQEKLCTMGVSAIVMMMMMMMMMMMTSTMSVFHDPWALGKTRCQRYVCFFTFSANSNPNKS